MPPRGLTPDAVVEAAVEIVDRDGVEALSLSEVARAVGVRTPSLYKHIDGLGDLQERLAVRTLDELTAALSAAALGRAGDDALRSVMGAWRTWALEHPRRYALVPVRPGAPGGDAEAAGGRLITVVAAVLRHHGLEGEPAIHAIRCLRATLHGFTVLEVDGGFGLPYELDATFDALVEMTVAGIAALAPA